MEVLRIRREYSVWVWDKVAKKYRILPSRLSSYDQAISYLEEHVATWYDVESTLDFNKFQIKMQEIAYSKYEVLYG